MGKIHERHQELMHYTTSSGLHGIVDKKTLWASHASFLNDREEVVGFFKRVLPKLLHEPYKRYLHEAGQEVAEEEFELRLSKIAKAYRRAEIATQDHYVMSFCATDDLWVSENGLLSQWRGYGRDGGYAIVFDTCKLDELFAIESRAYQDSQLHFGEVEYRMGDLPDSGDTDIHRMIKELKLWAYEFFKDSNKGEQAMEHITPLSTFCKHRGFEEEREVRLVISEPTTVAKDKMGEADDLVCRNIKTYIRNGNVVPCVHIFEDKKLKTLPINRVIIGPHPDKRERAKAVKSLLVNSGIEAKVSISDTPFRET